MKTLRLQPVFAVLVRPNASLTTLPRAPQARWAHKKITPKIPSTTPFVPDVETFLTLIGRGLKKHTSKFPSWEALFTLTSDQLREIGLIEARTRKYLVRWRQRFQQGLFGAGGDLKYVENGRAELRIIERDTTPMYTQRWVINVPPGKLPEEVPGEDQIKPKGYKAVSRRTVSGPYALPMKKGGAVVTVTEGMWEDKRGRKVDGGERRRDMVRFKKRAAERRELREKQGYF